MSAYTPSSRSCRHVVARAGPLAPATTMQSLEKFLSPKPGYERTNSAHSPGATSPGPIRKEEPDSRTPGLVRLLAFGFVAGVSCKRLADSRLAPVRTRSIRGDVRSGFEIRRAGAILE
eukprot:scaffold7169_cov26-Tisochrysis_lutea.AAC.2